MIEVHTPPKQRFNDIGKTSFDIGSTEMVICLVFETGGVIMRWAQPYILIENILDTLYIFILQTRRVWIQCSINENQYKIWVRQYKRGNRLNIRFLL